MYSTRLHMNDYILVMNATVYYKIVTALLEM